MNKSKRCESCKFYLTDREDGEEGLCRRFPPNLKSLYTTERQSVVSKYGWCGEYKCDQK